MVTTIPQNANTAPENCSMRSRQNCDDNWQTPEGSAGSQARLSDRTSRPTETLPIEPNPAGWRTHSTRVSQVLLEQTMKGADGIPQSIFNHRSQPSPSRQVQKGATMNTVHSKDGTMIALTVTKSKR